MKLTFPLLIKFQFFLIFHLISNTIYSQTQNIKANYTTAYIQLTDILLKNDSFKKAVFISEVVFNNNNFKEDTTLSEIQLYAGIITFIAKNLKLVNYKTKDSSNYLLNSSIYSIITKQKKALWLFKDDVNTLPFSYNFDDPQGDKDWTNTFVTKLLATHQGNCRSLTYLYKILADELGAKCWLALAPNHIYIRNYSKQIGWYNTELTSGTFPTDAWIAATGYVSTDAIRSGVYMDTLSNQQAIGLCILDLAQGYIRQTNNYTDGFVLKCCNLVLQYHAVNPEALLIKAEALKRIYLKEKDSNKPNALTTYNEMEQTYITLVKLGYREMPYKTYQKWLKSVKQDKEKYINQKLKNNFNK